MIKDEEISLLALRVMGLRTALTTICDDALNSPQRTIMEVAQFSALVLELDQEFDKMIVSGDLHPAALERYKAAKAAAVERWDVAFNAGMH